MAHPFRAACPRSSQWEILNLETGPPFASCERHRGFPIVLATGLLCRLCRNTLSDRGLKIWERRARRIGETSNTTIRRQGHDMKKWLALAALLLPLSLAGCSHPRPVYAEPPPPPDYTEISRQGFHDGFAAARRDVDQGKPPEVERHPRFRNPPVPPAAFEDYRRGFKEGYRAFLHHR
jgi:hypothetical protein